MKKENEILTLDDVAEVTLGVPIYRFKDEKLGKLQKVILQKSVNIHSPEIEYENEMISENIELKYYSKKGDIIFKLQRPNLFKQIDEENLIISSTYAIIRVKENFDSQFLFQLLISDFIEKQVKRYTEGRKSLINITNLKKLELPNICFDTQVKYGQLLTLIDKRIEYKEKDLINEYKLKESIINNIVEGKNE